MLETSITSKAILNIDLGLFDLDVDATVNTAGAEHLVFKAPLSFGNVPIYGIELEEVSMVPEIWFAVPFEGVRDVNNLPNSVVIPPGDILFVKTRVAFSLSIAGFNVHHMAMLEDVTFPNPGSAHTPLYYTVQSQSFAVGNLTSVSWRAQVGVSVSADIGINASRSGKGVMGYSGAGSVLPGNFFATLRITGIELCDIQLNNTIFQSVRLGTGFTFTKTPTETTGATSFSTTISLSGQLYDNVGISSSITLRPYPPTFGGVTLSITAEPFHLSFALDTMTLTSMSVSIGSELSIGATSGSWEASATGLEKGMTGASGRLKLSQGSISVATNVSFSQQGEKFAFTSWTNTFTLRFSPAVVTVNATFGKHGLSRAAVAVSVTF